MRRISLNFDRVTNNESMASEIMDLLLHSKNVRIYDDCSNEVLIAENMDCEHAFVFEENGDTIMIEVSEYAIQDRLGAFDSNVRFQEVNINIQVRDA